MTRVYSSIFLEGTPTVNHTWLKRIRPDETDTMVLRIDDEVSIFFNDVTEESIWSVIDVLQLALSELKENSMKFVNDYGNDNDEEDEE